MRVSKYTIYEIILFHIFAAAYALSFLHKDEWQVTILLFLLIAALMGLEYLRTHLFVSPLFFWYAFWLGAISLGRMDLNLYPFYQTWSVPLLKTILFNTLIFFWVYWLGELSGGNSVLLDRRSVEIKLSDRYFPEIVLFVLLLSCLAFVLNVIYTGCVPQLTEDPNAYRAQFVMTPFYKVVNFSRFIFACVPLALKSEKNKIKKISILVFSIIALSEEMLSGWRTYTMQALILLMTSFFIISDVKSGKNRIKNLRLVLLAAAAAVCFIGYIAVTRDRVTGALKEKINYLLYSIDMYIAPNFLNFQSAMDSVEPLNKALYSTVAFWSFLPHADSIMAALPEIDQSIGAFNVSTYLLQPYADYGLSGTLACSAVIAFLAGFSFKTCLTKKTVLSVVLLGTINIVIFLMHNNLFLRASSILMWMVLGAIMSRYLSVKGFRHGKTVL